LDFADTFEATETAIPTARKRGPAGVGAPDR
jgi:hypothetical protein